MPASVGGLMVFDAAAVRAALSPDVARRAVREAMIALAEGRVRQQLRSFIGLGEGRTFAIMPAALGERAAFGAKLVSVFADGQGRKSHEGVVVLFDGETGAPVCLATWAVSDIWSWCAWPTRIRSARFTSAAWKPRSR